MLACVSAVRSAHLSIYLRDPVCEHVRVPVAHPSIYQRICGCVCLAVAWLAASNRVDTRVCIFRVVRVIRALGLGLLGLTGWFSRCGSYTCGQNVILSITVIWVVCVLRWLPAGHHS